VILVKEDREVRYWCKVFDCSAVQLAEAIAEFGCSPERVRVFLTNGALCADRARNEGSPQPEHPVHTRKSPARTAFAHGTGSGVG
jgi:hypothetical protein